IEYGYSLATDLKPILARVSEPELQYATDEDTGGPDPLARRYDLSSNPLDYAQEQMRLARYHRGRILEHFVKEGDSWSKSRRGYELTLSMQIRSLSMMANWIGGVHIVRDKKGDMGDRAPLEVVPVERQRAALDFVLKNSFHDDVFGLSTELLQRMTKDKWTDGGIQSALGEPAWPIHDKIMGVQSSVLTMLMNPTTLRHIYDNEFRIPQDQDIVTLPEILDTVSGEVWNELEQVPENAHTARMPAISSLRRNLQREHINRLVDLSLPGAGTSSAYKPISNLARLQLRQIQEKAAAFIEQAGDKLDPYSKAHLSDLETQINKALDAEYIYNADKIGRESNGIRAPAIQP
ncbi:MAG: zinc-dependent metalloprotease, partial [Pirellulaceae bacterium]|nr:zinc-dependent metalloprotease [Pirellulaceae bacterium]